MNAMIKQRVNMMGDIVKSLERPLGLCEDILNADHSLGMDDQNRLVQEMRFLYDLQSCTLAVIKKTIKEEKKDVDEVLATIIENMMGVLEGWD